MAKYKIILLISILTTFTSFTFAQNTQQLQSALGVKGGVGLSFVSPNKGNDKTKSGYNFGIVYSRTINDLLFFRTGIEYITKGVDRQTTLNYLSDDGLTKFESNGKNKVEYEMSYIQIPATIGWNFVRKNDFSIYLNFGVYAAYGVSISAKHKVDGQITKSNGDVINYKNTIKYKKWDDLDLHRFDFGSVIGLGLKYDRVYLDMTHYYGALNLGNSRQNDSKTRMRWHNNNLSLSVGYNFIVQ